MDPVRWCEAFEAEVGRLASPGGLVLALACGEGFWSPWVNASGGREWGKNLSPVRKLLDERWQYLITGAWLMQWLSPVNGDELIRREFRRQKRLVALAVAHPDLAVIQRMQLEAVGVDVFAGAY